MNGQFHSHKWLWFLCVTHEAPIDTISLSIEYTQQMTKCQWVFCTPCKPYHFHLMLCTKRCVSIEWIMWAVHGNNGNSVLVSCMISNLWVLTYRTKIASIAGCDERIGSVIRYDWKMARLLTFHRLDIQIMEMAINLKKRKENLDFLKKKFDSPFATEIGTALNRIESQKTRNAVMYNRYRRMSLPNRLYTV